MAVDTTQSVLGATTPTDSTSKAASSRVQLAENMDTFLTMLTTQLKNQDPLSPMDSTEFTNQLVQFAQVEQQINGNQHLEDLLKLQKGNALSQALNYVGNTVKAESDQLALENGNAAFTYLLPEQADKVTIHVLDANGVELRQLDLANLPAGEHDATWDGTNNSGTQLADGAYKVVVEYQGADGKTSTARTSTIGRVTSVYTKDGDTLLSLGGADVPIDKVIAVVAPQQTTAAL